ncbi:hypothetical protein YPPY11_0963, partial [Yersinia pestis PY-11]
MAIDVNNT